MRSPDDPISRADGRKADQRLADIENAVVAEKNQRVEDLERELASWKAQHQQLDDDMKALWILIATIVGTDEDREAAACGEVDEFDPWHALREHGVVLAARAAERDYLLAHRDKLLASNKQLLAAQSELDEDTREMLTERGHLIAESLRLRPLLDAARRLHASSTSGSSQSTAEAVAEVVRIVGTFPAAEGP